MLERRHPLKPGPYYEDYGPGWTHDTGSLRIGLEAIRRFSALCSLEIPPQDRQPPSGESTRATAPESMLLQLAERLVAESDVTHERMVYLMQISAKFRHSVWAGDTLLNRISFISRRPALQPDRGVVVTEHKVITGQGHIALEYEAVRMVRCRGPLSPRHRADRPNSSPIRPRT